jgi:hypothetical protein
VRIVLGDHRKVSVPASSVCELLEDPGGGVILVTTSASYYHLDADIDDVMDAADGRSQMTFEGKIE